ncbi:hypothetical protein DH2020_003751 [Rehmannia glutinosa]|uniref:DNA polymerase alpha subunit B n=1 Tax=Rehmannia glutinosa TaxID=99300 RepID=A0ABR0XMN5_REHGL
MEEEIKAEFTKSSFIFDDEEEILSKCLTFCIQYKLSASDLVSSWEAYSFTRGLESTVRSSHMGAFLEQLQREQRDKVIGKDSGLHFYSNDVAMILNDNFEDTEGILDTPTDKRTLAHEKPSDSAQKTNGSKFTFEKPLESVTPFGSRKNKFVVQAILNQHPSTQSIKVEEDSANSEDDIIKRLQPSQKCSLLINRSQPEPGCRFMYDRIEDKFNFLENCIKKRAIAYVSSGRHEEPVDPSVASQKSIFAVGMICCEEEGRLKEKPVLLQSSVEHSGGQRVRLDLQKLNQFSIFPGQVVGVEGHNPSGHCLIASRIIDCVPSSVISTEHPPSKRPALDHNLQFTNPSQHMSEVSLIVAAGPFTTSDNLLFEPLTELLSYARPKATSVACPASRLCRVYGFDGACDSHAICQDANHDFVFPQIHSISNPGMFCANEVNVACCTVDILKHLSAEEICRNPQGGSKQRFYPLYPPAEDIPLDFSLANKALHFSSIPDILILPSDLAHFVKVLSLGEENDGEEQLKCICVNPGRLARGEGGGCFVEINYRGNPDSSSASIIRI